MEHLLTDRHAYLYVQLLFPTESQSTGTRQHFTYHNNNNNNSQSLDTMAEKHIT